MMMIIIVVIRRTAHTLITTIITVLSSSFTGRGVTLSTGTVTVVDGVDVGASTTSKSTTLY